MVTIQPNKLKLAVENINNHGKNINHLKNNKTKKLKHKKHFIKYNTQTNNLRYTIMVVGYFDIRQ
jgi:hypothetical protein